MTTNSHHANDNTDGTAVNHGVKPQNKLQLPLNIFISNLQSGNRESSGRHFFGPVQKKT